MKGTTTQYALGTRKEGIKFARLLINKKPQKNAIIIALEGHLGSGKTTFIQGLAKGLDVKEKVLSPTFLILKQFPIAFKNYKNFYHIDAYRLKKPEEIIELGFKDLIRNQENIVVVEWADKIKKILPRNIFRIEFINSGGNKRKIIFIGNI